MKKIFPGFGTKNNGIATHSPKINKLYIYLFAVISILILFVVSQLPINNSVKAPNNKMLLAAEKMEDAIEAVRDFRKDEGLSITKTFDPNQTGLIGQEMTNLTTTLGDLEAKRTLTNPNFASLMVILLKKAGVTEGQNVAIGASGSFPGALVATSCAVEAIGANPTIIYSLGSSMWGANMEGLTILEIHNILRRDDIISFDVEAASLGGSNDVAGTLGSEIREELKGIIKGSAAKLLYLSEFRDNVKARMDIYRQSADQEVKVFVNIGGAAANMGKSSQVLNLNPGINRVNQLPVKEKRGVIYEMAAKNIPIIHILNIKGLALKYQLPWDPIPLPSPGEGDIYDRRTNKPELFWLLFSLYFVLLIPGFVLSYKRKRET